MLNRLLYEPYYTVEIILTEVVQLTKATGKRLMTWGVASIAIGMIMFWGSQWTVFGGIGLQAIIWGGIDAVIAASMIFKKREQSIADITRTVSRSMYLDIIFQVAGLIVIVAFLQDPYLMGNGIGVFIQGLFLLILDRTYYNSLRKLEAQNNDTAI